MAFIFDISYVIAFSIPQSKTIFVTFWRLYTMLLTEVLNTINPKSLINDKDITNGQASITISKTWLRSIKKRISKTDNPWEIPISPSLFLFSYLSMISWTFQFDKKNFVYLIKFLSMFKSSIFLGSSILETWSNTPFTSINNTLTNIFLTTSLI